MSLLNAAMALGTLAFVVPLAIHLLFRSRFRSMDWGAMFLLRDVVEANRRRMQWHQWILLALRCAIPILLALAMARPLISSMKALPGSQPMSVVIVLDDSRSMSAAQRSSNTLAAVNDLLDSLSRQDEVILIPSSRLDASVAKGSVQDARDQLREVRFEGVSASLDRMVAAASRACSDASHPFRRIVLCSDFQENILDDVSFESIESLADSVEAMNPKPEIDFLNIAADENASVTGNVVVESIEVSSPAILVDRKVVLSATIRNDSDAAISGLRCIWAINGKDAHAESISVSPRSTAPVRWSHAFDVVGGASVTLSVQHEDALIADNRRRMAVDVMKQVRVWLVDGEPSTRPLESETDFLKVALSPFAFRASKSGNPNGLSTRTSSARSKTKQGNPSPQDIVSTKTFTLRSFQRALKQLSEKRVEATPDLLVFANLKQVPEIETYLATGGSVLFFDGDQIQPGSWQDCVWLPGKPFEATDTTTPFRIEPPGGRFAPWALLGDAGDSLFDTVKIQRYRILEPRDQQTTTLLRTESGQPLVMQRAFMPEELITPETIDSETRNEDDVTEVKSGRVVQFALTCDTAWSNLPLRPVFLPLIQQLILDLAGSSDQLNGPPGTIFNITHSDAFSKLSQNAIWRVSLPDGKSKLIESNMPPASDNSAVRFTETSRVGVYRFTRTDNDSAVDATSQATGIGSVRVVEIPAAESVLRPIVPELLDRAIAKFGGQSFSNADQWIASAKKDRFGMEIWRPLLMLLLAAMVIELLWQQRGGTKARVPGNTSGPRPVSSVGAT